MKTDKRWIGAGSVVVVAAAATVAVLALAGDESPPRDTGGERLSRTRTQPDIPQARWRVKTFPAGMEGPIGRGVKKAVKKQHKAIARTVTTVSDALVLAPESLQDLSGGPVSRSAAKALTSSRLPLPKKVTKVETTWRSAQIGLDHSGAARAAAQVTVRLKAEVEGKTVRLVHHSSLYLVKREGRWQVVAFDGTRKRLR